MARPRRRGCTRRGTSPRSRPTSATRAARGRKTRQVCRSARPNAPVPASVPTRRPPSARAAPSRPAPRRRAAGSVLAVHAAPPRAALGTLPQPLSALPPAACPPRALAPRCPALPALAVLPSLRTGMTAAPAALHGAWRLWRRPSPRLAPHTLAHRLACWLAHVPLSVTQVCYPCATALLLERRSSDAARAPLLARCSGAAPCALLSGATARAPLIGRR